jgi:hypothetical protein
VPACGSGFSSHFLGAKPGTSGLPTLQVSSHVRG